MKIVYTLIKILILILFLVLALTNTQSIVFHYLPAQAVNLPLIVLLLAFFVVGTLFGVLAMFRRLLSLRAEVNRLRDEVRQHGRIRVADKTAETVTESGLPLRAARQD